ncbi:MAG: protein-disulfide reductase DsbD domain-containing protein [Chitinophagales bacterium]
MRKFAHYTLIGLLMIFCFSAASAQVLEPAKWSFETEQISADTFLLHFDVKLDEGWYVYGQFISDEGPVPTTFSFSENKHVQLIGKASESGEIEKEGFDEIFGIDLKKFGKTARFSQKVVVGKKAKKISGELEYMTCDDTRCLPPQLVGFEFDLSKSKSGASEEGNESGFLEPVKWNIELKKTGQPEIYELIFRAEMDENWYLYSQFIDEGGPVPTSFNFDTAAHFSLIENTTELSPESKKGFDEIFQMELLKFGKSAEFTQRIKVSNADEKISGFLEYMTCDDTRCLPPQSIDFEAIPAKNYTALGDDIGNEIDASLLSDAAALRIEGLDLDNPAKQCGIEGEVDPKDQDKKKGLLNLFFLGFLGGLVALLTPCVFPMIPLTVSFFTKGSEDKKKGIVNATIYGFFIFGIYLILSLPFHFLDSINPDILNEISTNVYLNVAFFLIFIFFAGSFFGYYELTLPSALTNKMDSASDVGGIVGIFFMAVTLALVSFSCTGPILGSLLAGALSSDGGATQLSAGMGGFGLALALPFALFAAFPGWLNTLPKSGGWLNSVKVVLGFLELGLAVKFLSNADLVSHWGILKREIFFGIWIVIGVLMALYLFGKLKFPHDSPIKKLSMGRVALGAITVAFVLYLIPGLTNTKYANLQLLSGFPPPMFYSLYEQESQCPLNLPCYKDYEEGMAVARAENKPVMLDFTGWACVNCRRMEENVWVDPAVYKILSEEFVLISLYVDDRTELPEEEQIYVQQKNRQRQLKTIGNKWSYFQTLNFNNNSQPYYALLSPDEQLLNTPVGYMPDASEYAAFLNCGLNAFQNPTP